MIVRHMRKGLRRAPGVYFCHGDGKGAVGAVSELQPVAEGGETARHGAFAHPIFMSPRKKGSQLVQRTRQQSLNGGRLGVIPFYELSQLSHIGTIGASGVTAISFVVHGIIPQGEAVFVG